MQFLEHLRSQPQHVKARYTFLGAFFVTALVGTFWMMSLPAKFAKMTESSAEENTSAERTQTKKELSDFLNTTKEQFGSAIESMEKKPDTQKQVPGTQEYDLDGFAGTSSDPVGTSTETNSVSPVENASSTKERRTPRTVLIATTSSETGEENGQESR